MARLLEEARATAHKEKNGVAADGVRDGPPGSSLSFRAGAHVWHNERLLRKES